jgi:serine protein kinase
MNQVFSLLSKSLVAKDTAKMSLPEYLDLCKADPMAYASAAERMVKAIGEPVITNTMNDPRLSRIFENRMVKTYPAFSEFYGMEPAIEKIVSYFKHAADGLEESKQVLYLLGPVGSAKSSLAERLKQLMEVHPIYVLGYKGEKSPVFESPLGLFPTTQRELLQSEYGIPARYVTGLTSPWAVKRLEECGGDLANFEVYKLYPSKLRQIGIAKTEPGDENNQDISSLVGKVNLHMLDTLSQDDPDAYAFSGGLNKATQGLLEFVEMFKAPIKMLHPLLTATQERNYNGTEAISAIPFQGIILAHSNESEWLKFKSNRANEAFLDRVCIVKVPYCVRLDEEVMIYEKMVRESSLSRASVAPKTYEMLAEFSVQSRLKRPENSAIQTKLKVYNGESVKDRDPNAKAISEYRGQAGVDEGMTGLSTRFAFKVMSSVFDYDSAETAADPVTLMLILEQRITESQFNKEEEAQHLDYLKSHLVNDYKEYIGKEIQAAYIENSAEYAQGLFERYVLLADFWIDDKQAMRDPRTGITMDRNQIDAELQKTEKPAGINNPKDFRNEIVNYVLRYRANHGGANPAWNSYEKLKDVLEKRMFNTLEDMLPIISFTEDKKSSKEDEEKHKGFVSRMLKRGYTENQVRRLVDWYTRISNA